MESRLKSDSTEATRIYKSLLRQCSRFIGDIHKWMFPSQGGFQCRDLIHLTSVLPILYQGSVGPMGCRGDPGFEGPMVS